MICIIVLNDKRSTDQIRVASLPHSLSAVSQSISGDARYIKRRPLAIENEIVLATTRWRGASNLAGADLHSDW